MLSVGFSFCCLWIQNEELLAPFTESCLPACPHASSHNSGLKLCTVSQTQLNVFLYKMRCCGHSVLQSTDTLTKTAVITEDGQSHISGAGEEEGNM